MNIFDLNEALQQPGTPERQVVEETRRRWLTHNNTTRMHRRTITILYMAGLRELVEVFAYLASQVSPDATIRVRTSVDATFVTADWSEPV